MSIFLQGESWGLASNFSFIATLLYPSSFFSHQLAFVQNERKFDALIPQLSETPI